jgi:23S rRNA (cytidine1920-2'-O)/16S rRNA (cytidine1409-2'-O)-methyltransferase
VREGRVTVAGAPADNPARLVDDAFAVHISEPQSQFVSRGGYKLQRALDTFDVAVEGLRWLDAGASTGGFTDCLLQRGAAHVAAVDVGHSQLAWSMRSHARVSVYERVNARTLTPDLIGGLVDGCVADLSFISLATVAPALSRCVHRGGPLVWLIKPQFEAGPHRLGKGGVIRDVAVRSDVVVEVLDKLEQCQVAVERLVASPISGADGNHEFLAYARVGGARMTASAARQVVMEDDGTTSGPASGQNEP